MSHFVNAINDCKILHKLRLKNRENSPSISECLSTVVMNETNFYSKIEKAQNTKHTPGAKIKVY